MAAPAARTVTAGPELRHGALSLSEATVTGLSNMAPAMSLYFAISFIAGSVGAAIPFTFILAMIGILFTANSLAQFARVFPSAGSFITYITTSFGPQIGTVLATFLMVGYAVAAGAVYAVLGGWTADVLARDLGLHINWILLMFILLVAAEVLLVLGVQVSTRAALILFLFETAVLLVLGVIIVVNNSSHLSATPFAPPSGAALTGIATGFALAIYSYVGWEASAPLAEETNNPLRNVPIALLIAVVVLAAIYVFVTFAVVNAYGVHHMSKLASESTPFSTMARIYFGPLRGLVDIAGITSIGASTLALTNTQGRILFHGGRAGIFPGFLGRIHPRFQTPWIALITYGAMISAAVLVTMGWLGAAKLANDPFTIYGVLGTFGTLPIIIIYALTSIALIVYTARHSHANFNPITHYIVPAIGFLIMIVPTWSFFQTTSPPFDRVPEITLLLFAFALVYGLFIVITRPAAAARVGEAIEGEDRARGVPEFMGPVE